MRTCCVDFSHERCRTHTCFQLKNTRITQNTPVRDREEAHIECQHRAVWLDPPRTDRLRDKSNTHASEAGIQGNLCGPRKYEKVNQQMILQTTSIFPWATKCYGKRTVSRWEKCKHARQLKTGVLLVAAGDGEAETGRNWNEKDYVQNACQFFQKTFANELSIIAARTCDEQNTSRIAKTDPPRSATKNAENRSLEVTFSNGSQKKVPRREQKKKRSNTLRRSHGLRPSRGHFSKSLSLYGFSIISAMSMYEIAFEWNCTDLQVTLLLFTMSLLVSFESSGKCAGRFAPLWQAQHIAHFP